jgi:aldehyde dehydrogenase (NAD+)
MGNEKLLSDLDRLRANFQTGVTKSYSFRREQLRKLKDAVLQYEDALFAALDTDLKKSREEAWVTETGFVVSEINAALKHLRHWMNPQKVKTNLVNFPSSSYVMPEPLGVVLIIGPWNYPLQLLLTPLVGAIASGNCVVLKPSEFASATAAVIKELIESSFPKEYILYVEGEGAQIVPAMMNNYRFDHAFYTGSTSVGRNVYKMAADKLVPVTLELGGKSPCVVEEDANLKVAARRITVAKFSNAGQMCVAPDYVLVHDSKKRQFIEALTQSLLQFFSEEPEHNYNYGKIINEKQFDRLSGYLKEGSLLHGGRTNRETLFIEPTILEDIPPESSMMHEEIFGPILPIFGFTNAADAKQLVDKNPNPLAFYVFTDSKEKEKWWLENIPAGGACVNNVSWHLTNHNLPFGGRGTSGMGYYHGKFSFDTFSHLKAVLKTPTWFDPNVKYPPFKGKLSLFKKIIR